MTATREPDVLDAETVGVSDVQAASTSIVEAMVRGEIDIQIATAKRYPRSLELFLNRAISMATYDEETAESCLYRRPVGKKKNDVTGKWEEEYAEGMSIRMAEIVGACYGNLRVYAMLIEQTDGSVRARGGAIDLETNFASSSEVVESTLKANGQPFSPRMRVVVAKATLSKARRDATFQVVPRALARPIESAVRRVLVGDAQTLDKRRQIAIAWIGKVGIAPARVFAALGIEGPADLSAEKLLVLTGIRTAIKDGDVSIDDAFPSVDDSAPPRPAQRTSQQASAVTAAPVSSPPAVSTAAPAPPLEPAGSVSPAAPAGSPASLGRIVEIAERPTGTLVKLDTGFRCATTSADLIADARRLKDAKTIVQLDAKVPSDPKFTAKLVSIIVVPTGEIR